MTLRMTLAEAARLPLSDRQRAALGIEPTAPRRRRRKARRPVAPVLPGDGGPAGGPLLLTLTLPPEALNPNGRAGWRAKARAAKAARAEAFVFARHALARRPDLAPSLPWRSARIAMHWVRNGGGQRGDPTNRIAALKPVEDGLQDAGVLADDDRTEHAPPVETCEPGRPRLTLTISPLPN